MQVYQSATIKEVNLSSLNTAGNIKVNVYHFVGENGKPSGISPLNPGYFYIEATCGNQTIKVNNTNYHFTGENVVQTINWTVPLSWASQNTTGTSVSVVFKLYVNWFRSPVYVLENSKTVSISIPSSVKPSTSMALSDTTGYLSKYGSYIKTKSKVKVQLTNTLSYNSPIASYNIKANGVTYTTNPITTNVLNTAGTNTITAYVTDKRGRSSSTVSQNITVLDYANPNVNFSVRRCDEDGTLNENGGYCKVTYSASVSSLSNKNSKALKLSYKASSETTTTDVTLPMSGYSVTNQNYIFQALDDKSYNITLSATDDFITTTKSTVLSTSFTLMHFNQSGKGLAIGKLSEGDKFEVAMPAEFQNGINGIPDLKSAIGNAGLLPTTEIPANTNLNTLAYCEVGRYYCPMNTTVATLSNCPTTNAFVMEVYSPLSEDTSISPTGYVYRVRKILDYKGFEYIQSITIYNNTPTYNAWSKTALSTTVTVNVGHTTTGSAGTNASVTNIGDDVNVVLDFVIPKGEKGDTGSIENLDEAINQNDTIIGLSESIVEISKPKILGDDTDFGIVYTTSKSINLVNKSKLKRGFYVNNGKIFPSNDWCITDKINVNAGEKIYSFAMQITCFYKADNTFISQVVGASDFIVPNETAYLISCVTVANVERCYMTYRKGLTGDVIDNGVVNIAKKDYEEGFIPFTVPVRQTKSNNLVGALVHSEGDEDYVNVDCVLSLPVAYTSYGKPCKLLMMCHGAGQGVTGWKDNTGYKALVQKFLGRGYAVFDCNGFKNDALGWSFWGDPRGVDAWRKAYQYVVNNYNVEHEFSIYGFSMGGLTAMNLAFSGFPNIKCIGLGSPVLSLEACFNDSGAGDVVKLLYNMGDTYEPSSAYGCDPFSRIMTLPPVTKELSPKDKLISGYYVNTNGEIRSGADWNCTGYIDVIPNESLDIFRYGITCFYKNDKTFISYVQNVSSAVVPQDARYMRSCVTNTYKDTSYIKVTRSNKYVYGILPPIKIWYGSTETGSGTDTGTDLIVGGAVNKNIAKEFVQAINNGGGMAEYREVAGAGHEICYGMNDVCNVDYLLYFERHNKFVDRNTI